MSSTTLCVFFVPNEDCLCTRNKTFNKKKGEFIYKGAFIVAPFVLTQIPSFVASPPLVYEMNHFPGYLLREHFICF